MNGIEMLDLYEKNKHPNNNSRIYEIKLTTVSEILVISTRYYSPFNANDLFLERLVELQKIRDTFGLVSNGPFMAIFHEHYTAQFFCQSGDLEVLMPITKKNPDCPGIKYFGDFLAVTTLHVGSYPHLYYAYLALTDWVHNNGFEYSGPAVEKYIIDPTTAVKEENYITEVIIPVRKLAK